MKNRISKAVGALLCFTIISGISFDCKAAEMEAIPEITEEINLIDTAVMATLDDAGMEVELCCFEACEQITSVPRYIPTEEEFEILSKVVWNEARGEGHDGWVAVTEVVLNRIHSRLFKGNNVADIVFAKGQFSGIEDYDNWPDASEECKEVIRGVLNGTEELVINCDQVVFFRNPGSGNHGNDWTRNNASFYMQVRNHDFYYSNKDKPVI